MNPERLRSAPGGRGCPIGAGGTGGKCCAEDETLQSKVLIWDSLNLWKKKEVHAAAVEPPRARRRHVTSYVIDEIELQYRVQ